MADITWQETIQINAPIEEVYTYLADLPRHAEWAQSVVKLDLVRPGDQRGVGAQYRATERQAWQTDRLPRAPITRGPEGPFLCEVSELVPHHRIAWHAWAPYPVVVHAGDYAFDLAPGEAGGTRLTQTNRLRDNWLGAIVSRLVFKTTPAKARAQWSASLRNIKAILEERAARGVRSPRERSDPMQYLSRNGVQLAYEEAGRGAPTIVFVHGIACDHTDFAPQFAHFQREHRVVAVDLRGHGASDAPEQDYAMAAFADDLAWLCGELGIYKPVIVGHSMGGIVALELAVRHPDVAAAIAMLDSPVLIPPPVAEALAPLGTAMRSPAYREALVGFLGSTFGPADDPARKARLLDRAAQSPQHVVASCWEQGIGAFDSEAAARACGVPALYLSAGVPADLDRFAQLCPSLVVGKTVGAGHWIQLEVPGQVNAMIERFLRVVAMNPAAAGEGKLAPAAAD